MLALGQFFCFFYITWERNTFKIQYNWKGDNVLAAISDRTACLAEVVSIINRVIMSKMMMMAMVVVMTAMAFDSFVDRERKEK